MNVWLPGLLVVVVGLAFGLWFARRGKASPPSDGDVGADPSIVQAAPPAARSAMPNSTRRAALGGFAAGVASCLAIGGLIYWATVGAKPKDPDRADAAVMADAAQPEATERAHDESAALSPEVREKLQQLRARVEAQPQNLDARRELTVALLQADQLMEAFEQARALQKIAPEDPDGLFVEGVVRLAMGQWPLAVQLMDAVLAQHPDHVLAALAKGQAEAALGQMPQAIATWKKGLAAAGGSFAPIEELLAQAAGGGSEAPSAPGESTGMVPAGAPAAPATGAEVGASYRVHIELAPGTVATRGADGGAPTLFVALRAAAGGPPAAVKRISDPSFPLEVALSGEDSMMGQPLPGEGTLSIHLDGDGNAATREAADLVATVQAFSGTPVTIILEHSAP
ncbi:MAG: hypothetical protein ABIV06_00085 [Thermoanaerobaculia bacterium]